MADGSAGAPVGRRKIYSPSMTPSTGPEPPRLAARPATFVRRVGIRNYKSIGKADLTLSPLTILVGRNGSGKSNFLDALCFVADGLQTSLDHAVKSRGGATAVCRRDQGASAALSLHLQICLSSGRIADYDLVLLPRGDKLTVERESLLIRSGGEESFFEVRKDRIARASVEALPPVSEDRLYLAQAARFQLFGEVYESLTSMSFYKLNPDVMRTPHNPEAGEILHRDGSNIEHAIRHLQRINPSRISRIQSYLAAMVPDLEEVSPTKLDLARLSDGTLRALGILVAAAQPSLTLLGIEEPETGLHPAAAGALMDALREAAVHSQILVTSHSPDLLDQVEPENESFLAVVSQEGMTRIAPLDKASRQAIHEDLYTLGELFRLNQLEPDQQEFAKQAGLGSWPLNQILT